MSATETVERTAWSVGDQEFVEALENATLPAASFGHREHVRYAWLLLRRHRLASALPRISDALLRFATHHGAPGMFHATVTWTYVLVIDELMHARGSERSDFDRFLERNPLLLEPVPRLMSRFYAEPTWQSQRATETYVLPDRVRSRLVA